MSNPNEDTTIDTARYNQCLMNNVVRLPMVITEAGGSTLVDGENQRPLLDFWGDEGVCSLGYGGEFNKAIESFIATNAPHQLPDVYPHKLRWTAAELVCRRTEMDKAFFCNSGTEANEAMIKLARKYWWDKADHRIKATQQGWAGIRHHIMTVAGNFHGRTGFSLACSDSRVSPYHRTGFGPFPRGFGVIQWNQDMGKFTLARLDERDFDGTGFPQWGAVAAINLAPVLGNNCVHTYSMEFWAALAKLRQDTGVLLMYDDVQAGSGRCGHYATWKHPDIDVKPDIMALGKGLAMGLPAAMVLAREDVAESFTPGTHFNTFGGSPLVCYMIIRYFHWLDEHLPTVREKGQRIRKAFMARPWIREFDGAGLLNAFTPDYKAFGYSGFDFCHTIRGYGVSLVTHREHGPIRFTPPMNVSEADLDRAFWALDQTHQELTK